MKDLHRRLLDLTANLGEFAPTDPVPRPVAEVYNVLVEEAKKSHGNDPMVAQAHSYQMASNERYLHINCGALRTLCQQLSLAVRS